MIPRLTPGGLRVNQPIRHFTDLLLLGHSVRLSAEHYLLCPVFFSALIDALEASSEQNFVAVLTWLLQFKLQLSLHEYVSQTPANFDTFLVFFDKLFLPRLHRHVETKGVSESMRGLLCLVGLVNRSVHTHLAIMQFLFPDFERKEIRFAENKKILNPVGDCMQAKHLYFQFQVCVSKALLPVQLQGELFD